MKIPDGGFNIGIVNIQIAIIKGGGKIVPICFIKVAFLV